MNLSALAGAKTSQRQNAPAPKQHSAKTVAPNCRRQNGGAKKYPTGPSLPGLIFFVCCFKTVTS